MAVGASDFVADDPVTGFSVASGFSHLGSVVCLATVGLNLEEAVDALR